jgi:hypothetical protein
MRLSHDLFWKLWCKLLTLSEQHHFIQSFVSCSTIQEMCRGRWSTMSKAGDLHKKNSGRRKVKLWPNQTKPNNPFPSALPGRSGQRHPQQPTQRPKPKLNHSASTGNWFLLHVKIEALHPKQRTPNRTETSSFHATEPMQRAATQGSS